MLSPCPAATAVKPRTPSIRPDRRASAAARTDWGLSSPCRVALAGEEPPASFAVVWARRMGPSKLQLSHHGRQCVDRTKSVSWRRVSETGSVLARGSCCVLLDRHDRGEQLPVP
jgi:hypothetical protein